MKAFALSFGFFILCTSFLLSAQGPGKKNPRWVSQKGFWQIESNIRTPDKNIVYLYNKDNVLIYKENINGVVLNLASRRVKMRLKKALETAIIAWNKDHSFQSDQQWVSMLFRKQ